MLDFAYIVRDSVIPYITKDAKHILEHLASREGDNCGSWPSTQTLASCTNISLKGVQRAINCLLENHLITRESGKQAGRVNHYKVTLPSSYVEAWVSLHKKTRRVRQGDLPAVSRPDLPSVGRPVLPGKSNPSLGVGHGGLQIQTLSCEHKTTHTKQEVSSSVSSCCLPAAGDCQTQPQSGRMTIANEPGTTKGAKIVKMGPGKFSVDKVYAARICWESGSPNQEAYNFWRYNQARGWPLLATMTIEDIAKEWTSRWQRKHPDAYAHEQELRLEAKLRREERALRAAVAAGQ